VFHRGRSASAGCFCDPIASRVSIYGVADVIQIGHSQCRCDDSRRLSFIDGTRAIIFEKLPRNSTASSMRLINRS